MASVAPRTAKSATEQLWWACTLLGLLLCAGSVTWHFLAVPAAFSALGGYLTLPKRKTRWALGLVALTGVIATTSLGAFIVLQAVPGMVRGGQAAVHRSAVSRLREILFAEDAMRRRGFIDPDGDGIGSLALIGELVGNDGLRDGPPLELPVLDKRYATLVDTPQGKASSLGAYLYMICLPTRGGGWAAKQNKEIDDEAAERTFIAYAWPRGSERGVQLAFSIDQHENILVFDNRSGSSLRYAGAGFPPACDAALSTAWQPWLGKKPRQSLPGDPSGW